MGQCSAVPGNMGDTQVWSHRAADSQYGNREVAQKYEEEGRAVKDRCFRNVI